MLSHLDRRGFHAMADAAVENKVNEDDRTSVEAARAATSAAPAQLAGAATLARPAHVAGEETESRAEAISNMYAAAAARKTDSDGAGAAALEGGLAAPLPGAEQFGVPTSPPTATGPQWRSLGPWTVPNGQTYGSSRVNISGRVSAIAVHPTNPARVLCGAANGGVWESFDRGASWAPRTDYASTLTVGALAYDRTSPARVYCGLGEGNWWSWLGQGILRSLDGGTTWAPLCTAPFVGQGFYDLQVHPNDGQRLVAATTGGLYVSTNGGVNWTQRRNRTTWSVAIANGPAATAEMLAACNDGVFRSVDGGTTWTAVAIAGAAASWNRLAVAIAPSNNSVAYVWGAGAAGFLSRRAGGTWTAMPLPPGLSIGQAWYDWFLAAAPDRDNQVYVGAIEAYRADAAGTGWTWTNLSNKGASGDSIHPDQHAIAFEAGNANTIYIG
jgi:hypothetical protein